MSSFTFLHAADLHLATPFKGLSGLPRQLQNDVLESTFAAYERLVQLALEERVDFVLLCGDIYDTADGSLRAQYKLQQGLQQLSDAGISCYIIHGNHDPLESHRHAWQRPQKVHVFAADRVQGVTVCNRKGQAVAKLYGISYRTSAVTENLAKLYQVEPAETYHIAMLHGNVDGQTDHDRYAPCSLTDLLAANMDYWALGHIHTCQVMHENPWIVYPGNIQGRHINEQGEKGCYKVTVSAGKKSELAFFSLDAVRWLQVEVDIASYASVAELTVGLVDEIHATAYAADPIHVICRVILRGTGVLGGWLKSGGHAEELTEVVREACQERSETGHWIWVKDLKLELDPLWDRQKLLEEESFLGDLVRLAKQFSEQTEFGEKLFQHALQPLSGHAKAGKYVRDELLQSRSELLQLAEQKTLQLLLHDEDKASGWNDED